MSSKEHEDKIDKQYNHKILSELEKGDKLVKYSSKIDVKKKINKLPWKW